MSKMVIFITQTGREPGAATLGFLSAQAALSGGMDVALVLRGEGVLFATAEGWAAGLHEVGYPPLRELRDSYVAAGGPIYLSRLCARRYRLTPDAGLIPSIRFLNVDEMVALCVGATTLTY